MKAGHLSTVILHGRVRLMRLEVALASVMFKYVDRERQRLRLHLPWVDAVKAVEDERAFIELCAEKWEKCEQFAYGIFRKEDGCYMGNISVHNIAWEDDCCELGYWLLGDFEGQGYMSEAVQALGQACFDFGFHRVEIRCSPGNLRSAAVPRRCGFTFDGALKENRREHGGYADTLVFAKINPASRGA